MDDISPHRWGRGGSFSKRLQGDGGRGTSEHVALAGGDDDEVDGASAILNAGSR
jgi:hypothetical protein